MQPADLKPEDFHEYPPKARGLAIEYLPVLMQLPLVFLPLLLHELMDYDWKFPAEQDEIERQLLYLKSLPAAQLSELMAPFAGLHIPPQMGRMDWINSPEIFTMQLSSVLWTTAQMGMFSTASQDYIKSFYAWKTPAPLPLARFTMAAIGSGVAETQYPLFRKLRRQGTCYMRVNTQGGIGLALKALSARAAAAPVPFGHWYISGGDDKTADARVTAVSYGGLAGARVAVLKKMRTAEFSGGPEELHAQLLELQPKNLGLDCGKDEMLNRFQLKVLTEGSGTQIFSTSFVEWTGHEAMKRAQPITMFARFTPRRRSASLDEMIANGAQENGARDGDVDPEGSLIDADMGAYYLWLSQCRLPEAEKASFLVWFEDHAVACCVSPAHRPGTESDRPVELAALIAGGTQGIRNPV